MDGRSTPLKLVRRHNRPDRVRRSTAQLRFHNVPHTAANLPLDANVNTGVVSEMVGHTEIGVTMDPYQHVTPTMQQEAPDAFDALQSATWAVNLAVKSAAGRPVTPSAPTLNCQNVVRAPVAQRIERRFPKSNLTRLPTRAKVVI